MRHADFESYEQLACRRFEVPLLSEGWPATDLASGLVE
jgi:hypothetical protein